MAHRRQPQKIYGVNEKRAIKLVARLLRTKKIDYQKTFSWLLGDKGTSLRVDAYFPNKKLVAEYHGKQHFESNQHMDRRPGRAEQRRKYTRRRKLLIPRHNLKLLEIRYDDERKDVQEKLMRLGYKI